MKVKKLWRKPIGINNDYWPFFYIVNSEIENITRKMLNLRIHAYIKNIIVCLSF